MADCRVSFDADAMQHTVEFRAIDASCRRIESGNVTAWVGEQGVAILVIDRDLDGTLDTATAAWSASALGPSIAAAILDGVEDATIEFSDAQAAALAVAVNGLVSTGALATSRDSAVGSTAGAGIVQRSGDSRELSGDSWVPVVVHGAQVPLDGEKPASVVWRPPTGEFVVGLPTTEGGTWPGDLWLRVTSEPEGWVIAAAPVAPNGEARTVVAKKDPTFDGLRLDVATSVSEGTALDGRRSRERLASLAAVATEAEQAGDFATAAAAWTAAAAFADEILDDSAAQRFRHRAEETAASHGRTKTAPDRRRWWLVAALIIVAILLVALGVWLGSSDTSTGQPIASSESVVAPDPAATVPGTGDEANAATSTTASSTTTTLPTPTGPVRSTGVFRQSLGQGHGPLEATLEIDVSTPVVPVGGAVEVRFEFRYEEMGRYPANGYDECLRITNRSRNTGGWKSQVPAYVVIERAANVSADALSSYWTDVSLSDFRDVGVGPVALTDSQVINCGDRPPANSGFQVDQRLIFQIYSATIDVSDLGPGTYVLIPTMTPTAGNDRGFPDSVDGSLVGFTIE